MDEGAVFILAGLMAALVIPLSMALAFWLVMRGRRRSDQPLSPGPGGIVVPVRGLSRRLFPFGYSKNNLNPRFEITGQGLSFRVLRTDHWPFSCIQQVDAPRVLLATRISFRNGPRRLFVDVAGEARARDLLRALPPSLPLTARAIALRDRSP